MKKQNLIIIIIFILLIIFFCVFNYFNSKDYLNLEIEEEITKEEITIENTKEITQEEVLEIEFFDIYVYGEVYKADIYRVPSNWTLNKLFNLVGLKASADISGFNLAELVKNNETYYIPRKNSNISNDLSLININTASKEELMELSGIGEVIADRIIEYRNKNKFKSIEDIKNVSGIGDAMYEKIKDYITVR